MKKLISFMMVLVLCLSICSISFSVGAAENTANIFIFDKFQGNISLGTAKVGSVVKVTCCVDVSDATIGVKDYKGRDAQGKLTSIQMTLSYTDNLAIVKELKEEDAFPVLSKETGTLITNFNDCPYLFANAYEIDGINFNSITCNLYTFYFEVLASGTATITTNDLLLADVNDRYLYDIKKNTHLDGINFNFSMSKYEYEPNVVNAVQNGTAINVNWQFIPAATEYKVYYRKSTNPNWTYWKNVKTNGLIDSGVTDNTTYYYAIEAASGYFHGPKVSSNSVTYHAPKWEKINGKYYLKDYKGQYLKGWQTVNGSKYYLDPNTNIMAEGWTKIDNYYYYFKPNGSGKLQTGWQYINSGYFYLDPKDGHMYEGFQYVDESEGYFYFKPNGSGRMLDGWQIIDGKYHYFKPSPSGRMLTGWQYINGAYFYLDPDTGEMYEGFQYVDESEGYFYFKPNGSGRMLDGWQIIDGKYHYFKPSPSGRMLTGWQNINGSYYFLEDDETKDLGYMYEGKCLVNAKGSVAPGYFYFKPNGSGKMQTGWMKVDGNWYYASSSGRFAIGWNTIDNKKFYFEPDETVGIEEVAKMYLGYKEIDGDHYYFRETNESGRMETGDIYVPGYGWKYFDPVTGKETKK